MGIVEYEKEIWEVQPVKSLAQTLYDKQVKDITNISHTEWFKQIKDYWKRVWDGAKEELKTVSPENLKTTQMKCWMADSFVYFLENLESTQKVSEMVKK